MYTLESFIVREWIPTRVLLLFKCISIDPSRIQMNGSGPHLFVLNIYVSFNLE